MMRRQRARVRRLSLGAVVAVLGAWIVSLSGPSVADVTAVKGSAYGFRAFNIALFNSAQADTGPTPTVALAADASNSPQSASVQSGLVKYGPAVFFSSDAVAVSTRGTTGAGGSVTSAADIANVNKSTLQPAATGSEAFTADRLQSTCTVTETNPQTGATSFSGTTTITGGTLMLDTGEDLNQDGDFTDAGEHAPVVITLPTNPAPGTVHDGHIHVNGGRDDFRYIFNEQIASSDGSVTVNAVHLTLLGPTATGDVILGQVVCGLTTVAVTTSSTAPPATTTTTIGTTTTTSTTVPPTTSTTVPPTTSTTVPPTTSTTLPPTTSTTVPPTTSTTVPPTTSTTSTTLVISPTTTITGDVTTGLLSFVVRIICDVLRSLVGLPFVGPFIQLLLPAFGC